MRRFEKEEIVKRNSKMVVNLLGGSPGLVVKGGESHPRDCWFESWLWILETLQIPNGWYWLNFKHPNMRVNVPLEGISRTHSGRENLICSNH